MISLSLNLKKINKILDKNRVSDKTVDMRDIRLDNVMKALSKISQASKKMPSVRYASRELPETEISGRYKRTTNLMPEKTIDSTYGRAIDSMEETEQEIVADLKVNSMHAIKTSKKKSWSFILNDEEVTIDIKKCSDELAQHAFKADGSSIIKATILVSTNKKGTKKHTLEKIISIL